MFSVPTGTNIQMAKNVAVIFPNSTHKTIFIHFIDWNEMLYTVNIIISMFVSSVYGLLISVWRKTAENNNWIESYKAPQINTEW